MPNVCFGWSRFQPPNDLPALASWATLPVTSSSGTSRRPMIRETPGSSLVSTASGVLFAGSFFCGGFYGSCFGRRLSVFGCFLVSGFFRLVSEDFVPVGPEFRICSGTHNWSAHRIIPSCTEIKNPIHIRRTHRSVRSLGEWDSDGVGRYRQAARIWRRNAAVLRRFGFHFIGRDRNRCVWPRRSIQFNSSGGSG